MRIKAVNVLVCMSSQGMLYLWLNLPKLDKKGEFRGAVLAAEARSVKRGRVNYHARSCFDLTMSEYVEGVRGYWMWLAGHTKSK